MFYLNNKTILIISAISNQIEVLSKSIVSSISSLTFPHDSKFHGKDKKSTGKPALLVDSIDISILLLMHIVSSTKLLKEIMIKKVLLILLKFL
jgi:hypothetical protein